MSELGTEMMSQLNGQRTQNKCSVRIGIEANLLHSSLSLSLALHPYAGG